jgi:SRSO17 transposase
MAGVSPLGLPHRQCNSPRPTTAPYTGRGRRPRHRYRDKSTSLKQLALAAGQSACVDLIWRRGSKGMQRSRFLALRVRPAGITPRRQAAARAEGVGWELPARWLLAEWPTDKPEPVKYWLSNLPAATSLVELVRLGKLRWRVEHDYRELKGALGLDHYEGHSFGGWHHHVTLVSAAHGFLTLERLAARNRRRRPDLVAAARRAAGPARLLGRRLSPLPPSRAPLAPSPRTSPRADLKSPTRRVASKIWGVAATRD